MKIEQDQHYEGEDWWSWSVWIDADPVELETIEKVLWHLHPTFPEPVRTHTNRAENFRLSSAGWGCFAIRADVVLANGATRKLKHELTLLYPDGSKTDE